MGTAGCHVAQFLPIMKRNDIIKDKSFCHEKHNFNVNNNNYNGCHVAQGSKFQN